MVLISDISGGAFGLAPRGSSAANEVRETVDEVVRKLTSGLFGGAPAPAPAAAPTASVPSVEIPPGGIPGVSASSEPFTPAPSSPEPVEPWAPDLSQILDIVRQAPEPVSSVPPSSGGGWIPGASRIFDKIRQQYLQFIRRAQEEYLAQQDFGRLEGTLGDPEGRVWNPVTKRWELPGGGTSLGDIARGALKHTGRFLDFTTETGAGIGLDTITNMLPGGVTMAGAYRGALDKILGKDRPSTSQTLSRLQESGFNPAEFYKAQAEAFAQRPIGEQIAYSVFDPTNLIGVGLGGELVRGVRGTGTLSRILRGVGRADEAIGAATRGLLTREAGGALLGAGAEYAATGDVDKDTAIAALLGATAAHGTRRAGLLGPEGPIAKALPDTVQQAIREGEAGAVDLGAIADAVSAAKPVAKKIPLASLGAYVGYESAPEDASPFEQVLYAVAGAAGVVAAREAVRKLGTLYRAGEILPESAIRTPLTTVPKPKTTPGDRLMAMINKYVPILGRPFDEIATPVMKTRDRLYQIMESQSARVVELAKATKKQFRLSNDQRILTLPGRPTIADAAAKFGYYRQFMTESQVKFMEALRDALRPYRQFLEEAGRGPFGLRRDIEEGGFYIPRERTTEEGLEEPMRRRSGGRGSKLSAEHEAVFDTQAQAIEAGYEVLPLDEAIASFTRSSGRIGADTWVVNELRHVFDTEGRRIVGTGLELADPELRAAWEIVNRDLIKLRSKIDTALRRAKIANIQADEIDRAIEQVMKGVPEEPGTIAKIPPSSKLRAQVADLRSDKMRKPPRTSEPIRIKMPPTRQALLKADQIEQAMKIIGVEVPDDIKKLDRMDAALRRTQKRIDTLNSRGAKWANRAEELQREFEDLKARFDELKPMWERAKSKPPPGYRMLDFRGLRFPLSGLSGVYYPDAMANAIDHWIEKQSALYGRGSQSRKVIEAVNDILRMVGATADFSWMMIQGLPGFAKDPEAYIKAWKLAMKSHADDTVLGAFFQTMDRKAAINGLPTSEYMASKGLHFSGGDTEFTGGFTSFGQAVANAPSLRIFNRAFSNFGDALRYTLYQNAWETEVRRRGLDAVRGTDFETKLAEAVNRATGHSYRRLGGDLGSILLFAPRFFNSQIEMLVKAATDGSIQGAFAREALLQMIGLGMLFTYAINEAQGIETDWDMLKEGRFPRARIGDQKVALLGTWDSLANALAHAAKGDWQYIPRTKASPIVKQAWDLLTGKDFMGRPTGPFEGREGWENWLRSFGPIALQEIGREHPLATLIESTGGKASPLTPFERYQGTLEDAYKEWEPPLPYEKPDNPREDPLFMRTYELANPDARPAATTELGQEIEAQRAEWAEKIKENNREAMNDEKTLGEWRDQRRDLLNRQSAVIDYIMRSAKEREAKKGTPLYWLQTYYDIFDQAELPDGSIDSELFDELFGKWIEENGEVAKDYVYAVTEVKEDPIDREYVNVIHTLADAGYFDREKLPRYKGLESGVPERALETLEDLVSYYRNTDEPWLDTGIPAFMVFNNPDEPVPWDQSAVVILEAIMRGDLEPLRVTHWKDENGNVTKEVIRDVLRIHQARNAIRNYSRSGGTVVNEDGKAYLAGVHPGLIFLDPDYVSFWLDNRDLLKWLDFGTYYSQVAPVE